MAARKQYTFKQKNPPAGVQAGVITVSGDLVNHYRHLDQEWEETTSTDDTQPGSDTNNTQGG